MKKYDYIIIGAGLFGSVFAQQMTDAGASCLIIEKRNHIGGNCYDEYFDNILVHKYGAHIFHTSNEHVWKYVNNYANFNHFRLHVKSNINESIFSFPINLFTLYQLWGVKTPSEAEKKLNDVKIKINNPSNFEEYALSQIGEQLYSMFIYGYTKKQWGIEPNLLPAFIFKRLPVRLIFNDNYYYDNYQGIPVDGYTQMIKRIIGNTPVILNTDFLENKTLIEKLNSKIVYTGAIDEFFNYELGSLDWRSLKFKEEIYEQSYFQGGSVVTYPSYDIPFTRIIEHKFFNFVESNRTIITKEYSVPWTSGFERYYPVNNEKNQVLYAKYKELIPDNYIFSGRLAEYKYYDMDKVIEAALNAAYEELKNKKK